MSKPGCCQPPPADASSPVSPSTNLMTCWAAAATCGTWLRSAASLLLMSAGGASGGEQSSTMDCERNKEVQSQAQFPWAKDVQIHQHQLQSSMFAFR